MSLTRADFGSWSSALSLDDLACVLAELGFTGDGTWRLPDRGVLDIDAARARQLASAWRAGRGAREQRIEIVGPFDLPGRTSAAGVWLAECLARSVTAAGSSVYVRQDDPPTAVGWHWPMTIGLAGDPASRRWRDLLAPHIESHQRLGALVRLAEPGPARDSVDLLVLPLDLPAALSAALQAVPPLRADCAIVLGRGGGSIERTASYLSAMREAVRTAGVALAPVPADPAAWLIALVAALSHDRSIDAALFDAAREIGMRPPLLVASGRLIRYSRIASDMRDRAMSIAHDSARGMNAPAAPGSALERIGETMGGAREEEVRHETDTASLGAEGAAAAEVALAGQPPAPVEPRFIQAQLRRLPGEDPTPAFIAAALHAIDVRIGPAEAGWLGPEGGQAFPDEELPRERDAHELRVALVEPRLLPEPQAGVVRLPRRGASSVHRFLLEVPAGADRVDARIIVSYGNRVLQTAVIAGAVGDPAQLSIEAVVRPAPAGLDDRRRFDAAVVMNQERSGAPSFTKLASGHVAFTTAPDLQQEIDWFDRQFTDVARNRRDYAGGLASATTVDLLRSFALHGSLLHQYLVTDTLGDDGIALGERIQIVSTSPEARLPVEFVYERKPPDDDAPLCPQALAALASGACDASCPRGDGERTVVCPLGFWGVSRVIERHAHDPRTARSLGARDFAFQAEPMGMRQTVSVLQGAQIAASHRVEDTVPDGIERLRNAADPVLHTPAVAVKTWTDWADRLDGSGRSLLVLLVHTDTAGAGDTMPQMEIGDGSWLSRRESISGTSARSSKARRRSSC